VREFASQTGTTRVVFGYGTIARLPEELDRLDAHRALVLCTPGRAALARRVVDVLSTSSVGVFDEATMHTPVEVTDRALVVVDRLHADAVVAVGGGSTTGLAKAVASRRGVRQLVIPTTYAGSEVTSVLGETAAGQKTTRSDPRIQQDTVIYDVDLSRALPWAVSVTSAVNAMAHAVEALYAVERTADTDRSATEALAALASGLRALARERNSVDARSEMLFGAWRAGVCLGTVSMGLHHRLCHTLGGSFQLPHAATHTALLPYVMDFNEPVVRAAVSTAAAALEVPGPAGLRRLIASLGGPTDLAVLGFGHDDVSRAADLATAKPYPNPRPVTSAAVAELLERATAGAPIRSTG
jgi:maleylacetate reductase